MFTPRLALLSLASVLLSSSTSAVTFSSEFQAILEAGLTKLKQDIQAYPKLQRAVQGVPMDVAGWAALSREEIISMLRFFNDQDAVALQYLLDTDPENVEKIGQFNEDSHDLMNVFIDHIKTGDFTAAPSSSTPAPTPKTPEVTTPTPKTPEVTTPAPTDAIKTPEPVPTPVNTLPANNGTSCSVLENKDRLGFDLGSAKGPRSSCAVACEQTNGCQTWTWNDYQGGTCWLKTHAGKLVDKTGVSATDCVVDRPSWVCNAYKDIDFVGMDIGNKPGKSFADCCDICSEFGGCTAYAWNDYQGGTCWLKKSVGHVIAKPGAISSSTVQLYGPVCPFEYDVDFIGNDIGNKPAADAGVCCSLCKGNKDCKAYTWSKYNGGTCWMKSGKGKAVSASGVISAALAGF